MILVWRGERTVTPCVIYYIILIYVFRSLSCIFKNKTYEVREIAWPCHFRTCKLYARDTFQPPPVQPHLVPLTIHFLFVAQFYINNEFVCVQKYHRGNNSSPACENKKTLSALELGTVNTTSGNHILLFE